METIKKAKNSLKRGLHSPKYFVRDFNRLYFTVTYGPDFNRSGFNIMAEDWDILVILDACRYDLFMRTNTLPGRLETRISRGSHTTEFLRGNFCGKEFHDTVYVTATPQLEWTRYEIDVSFYAIVNVWNSDSWDDRYGTVLPDEMTERGLIARENFPNKRLILHYLQPHYPFIYSDIDNTARGLLVDSEADLDFWERQFNGITDISPQDVWSAYRANLELALNSIQSLIKESNERIVITSDHGNMIGEKSYPIPLTEWGHPPKLYTKQLVEVPWLVHESNDRPTILSGDPIRNENISKDVTESRLADLGYLS